ncbi:thyrotroph embryonic factor [Elysia marginata]|uniref:Thyrotroph embryonic factor n=1 Tax=Elysia marginata TaxID=1093978 RepID=A0AAV4FYW9_9GAST|nr:thyrotroph embryonic factor [Elysia marginata]
MSKDQSVKNSRLETSGEHDSKRFDADKRSPSLYPDSSAEVRAPSEQEVSDLGHKGEYSARASSESDGSDLILNVDESSRSPSDQEGIDLRLRARVDDSARSPGEQEGSDTGSRADHSVRTSSEQEGIDLRESVLTDNYHRELQARADFLRTASCSLKAKVGVTKEAHGALRAEVDHSVRDSSGLREKVDRIYEESRRGMSGPGGLMQHQQQRHRQLSQQQRERGQSLSDQQQQQQPQPPPQHHRQMPLGGPMGQHQQVYGDPGDYLRLATSQPTAGGSGMTTAPSLLGLDPSLGAGPPYNYDEIDLTDPVTTNALLTRNELMTSSDSLIQQREQDLNLVSSNPPSMPSMPSSSSSMHVPVPGFLVPNRSLLAARSGLLGSHDPIAMLFDQPPQPQPGGYNANIGNTSSTYTSSSGGLLSHTSSSSSNFLMDAGSSRGSYSAGGRNVSSALNGGGQGNGSSNGGGRRPHHQHHHYPHQQQQQHQNLQQRPLASTSTNGPFLVKQEADEGNFVDEEDSLSRSSTNSRSPTKSDAGQDSRVFATPSGSDDRKRGIKRTMSNCSSSSAGGGAESGDTKVSKPSPSSQSGRNGEGTGCSSSDAVSPGTSSDTAKSAVNGADNPKERDPAYLEKRRKNNESAKRSREARRTKEELVAFKVINLEEENMKLRAEIRLLDKELDELRTRLYQVN